MLSNTKQHSLLSWKHTTSISSRQNSDYNQSFNAFHCNTTPNKTTNLTDDQLGTKNSNLYKPFEQTDVDENKNCEDINDDAKNNVFFEKIVPRAVKQMWVKASDPNTDYNIDVEHNIHQNMLRYNHHQKLDKRLSHEIGSVFISRDLANELVEEEKRKEEVKHQKNESVIESTELPAARSKWGINLRHVKVGEENGDKLPYGFPRLRRLSSGDKQRTHSTSEDSVKLKEGNNNIRRAQSTDALDKSDTVDSCVVDVDQLNDSVSDENIKKMSVLERMKNFQNKSYRHEDFDKYAHFRSSQKSQRNKTPPTFFQSENSNDLGSSMTRNNQETRRNRRLSLVELLKQDELNLSVDVVDSKSKENDIVSKENDTHTKDYTASDSLATETPPQDLVGTYQNRDISKRHLDFDRLNKHASEVRNNLGNATNQKEVPKIEKSQPRKNVVKSLHEEASRGNTTLSKEANKLISEPLVRSPQQKTKIVRKVFTSAPVSPVKDLPKASPRKEYQFNLGGKVDVPSPPSLVNSNIKYNKLGQVILSDLESVKDNENTSVHTTVKPGNSIVKPDVSKVVQHVDEENTPVPVARLIKPKTDNQKLLQNGYDHKKSSNQNSFDVSISSTGNKMSVTNNATPNTISQPKMVTVAREQVSKTVPVSISNGQTKSQPLPSLSKQKRRVGKLIIMTGEQRDEQLRNKASAKSVGGVRQVSLKREVVENVPKKQNQGFALTFVSNELDDLDEDPNLPPPKVPKIIFNSPVIAIKSIMLSGVNKNKNRKTKKVAFSTQKLATIYSYPSESSYYQDELMEGNISNSAPHGLSGYQPSSVNDLGTVIQRERDRLQFSPSMMPAQEEVTPQVIQYSTEGDHFNTHNTQEGGHALLF